MGDREPFAALSVLSEAAPRRLDRVGLTDRATSGGRRVAGGAAAEGSFHLQADQSWQRFTRLESVVWHLQAFRLRDELLGLDRIAAVERGLGLGDKSQALLLGRDSGQAGPCGPVIAGGRQAGEVRGVGRIAVRGRTVGGQAVSRQSVDG